MGRHSDDQLILGLDRDLPRAVQAARSLRAAAGLDESLVSSEIVIPLHTILRSPRARGSSARVQG